MQAAITTVTLRSQSPEEVIATAKGQRIHAIEWAGDVHVPPGDFERAASVKALCEANGIIATSYGSYYQCDLGGAGSGPFQHDLGADSAVRTAQALGVNGLRVWAGRQGSADAGMDYREEVAGCLRKLCDRCSSLGINVHLEFHRNSLTDTAASAIALIDAVARDNLYCYWQPRHGASVQSNLADIHALGSRLSHVHVFHWLLLDDGTIDRRPLKEGMERWQIYLDVLSCLPGQRYAMIEFVRDNKISQLADDALVLHSLLA